MLYKMLYENKSVKNTKHHNNSIQNLLRKKVLKTKRRLILPFQKITLYLAS